MNFLGRFTGTFSDPGKTFRAIAEKPRWVDALIVLLILTALYNYVIFPIGTKDGVKMLEDNAARIKEKWGEERYNQFLERTKSGSPWLASVLLVPASLLIGLLFSALIVLGMGRLTSTQGSYLQVFSLFIHANFVDKFLGNGLRLFLVMTRQSVLQTSTGLPVFFPKLEVTSLAYLILSQVDFFQVWLFAIFGLGLSQAFKIDTKKALFISYLFWLLKCLLNIALGYLRIQVFR